MTSPRPDRHDAITTAGEELAALLEAEQASALRRLELAAEALDRRRARATRHRSFSPNRWTNDRPRT